MLDLDPSPRKVQSACRASSWISYHLRDAQGALEARELEQGHLAQGEEVRRAPVDKDGLSAGVSAVVTTCHSLSQTVGKEMVTGSIATDMTRKMFFMLEFCCLTPSEPSYARPE